MRFFWSYLVSRRRLLGVLAGVLIIFIASFALYRLPLGAVMYPALISFAVVAAAGALDFIAVRRRHLELRRLASLPASLLEVLPAPSGPVEADYQEILRALREEYTGLELTYSGKMRDMTEYYALWAHQIKTPITSMGLALESEDSPLARRLTSDLRDIQRYVDMVMAFLRVDSESSDFVFREHPIDAIVRESVAGFASQFISKRIRLDYETIPGTVVTDEKWLSFVLGQLLSNALKYTKSGAVSIYMEEPKALCISDTGIGIAPEDLPRVFERGYTGCNGRADKRASGIGLYLCRRVCEKLGVGISIESELGAGTTVKLDLRQYELRRE